MPQTEAQRRATRNAHAKKLAIGFKRQQFFMAPDAAEALDVIRSHTKQSVEGAINSAIIGYAASLRRAPEPHRPPAKAITPAKPSKGAQRVPERVGVGVQIGPTPVAPGSRLKKR